MFSDVCVFVAKPSFVLNSKQSSPGYPRKEFFSWYDM